MSEKRIISVRMREDDNVAVVASSGGLPAGIQLEDGTLLNENIPQGHKVALIDLLEGDAVIRYGEVIGFALQPLKRGDWVNEDRIQMPEARQLDGLDTQVNFSSDIEPLEGYTFEGYRNADGTVGTKNVLAISTSVQCVAGVLDYAVKRIKSELLPEFPNVDDVFALNHTYGCGVAINAPAAIVPIRTLQNIARNPNFGNEVMVLGLGCEKLRPERLIPDEQVLQLTSKAAPVGEPSPILSLQDENLVGFDQMIDAVLELAKHHLGKLNQRQRETCAAAELIVGMQCGGSDALSGITANPAVGFATDLIVRAGGTVMFSEVTEVRDGIHLLTKRAKSTEVAQALIDQMAWYDNYLHQGQVDRSANTTPGNKKGGLSNIVEKALGSIIKSGTTPIVDVVEPGERVRKRGLNFAATPASDFICGTLQLAAGMNMQVFTTGRGTPYGLSMVPVIKVSTNEALSTRWHDLIDLDAGRIANGQATIEDIGWELFHLILDVASGKKTVAADRLGLHNDLVLFNPAPVT